MNPIHDFPLFFMFFLIPQFETKVVHTNAKKCRRQLYHTMYHTYDMYHIILILYWF